MVYAWGSLPRAVWGQVGLKPQEEPAAWECVWDDVSHILYFRPVTHVNVLKFKKMLGPYENKKDCWDQNPPPLPSLETWATSMLCECVLPCLPHMALD